MSKEKNGESKGVRMSLAFKIGMVSILPLIVLATVLTIVGVNNVRIGMRTEVMEGLKIQLESFQTVVESKDSGSYTLDDQNNVLKGTYNITDDVETFDRMVEETGLGVTLFYAVLSVASLILGDILMATVDPRISFTTKDR